MSEQQGSANGSHDSGGLTLERYVPDAIPPLVDAISSLYEHAIDRLFAHLRAGDVGSRGQEAPRG